MLLFPEATTGDGLALRKFHSSHFAAARDLLATASEVETVFVQPGASAIQRPRRHGSAMRPYWPHLWSILKGEPIRCDLAFGKPLAYGRGENRKVIARQAASAIASMLASMARGPSRTSPSGPRRRPSIPLR
jgi:lyso-ornithine lipid O-acyltransferase